jgi:predicted Zn-dependent protease/cold shock CspA family protein
MGRKIMSWRERWYFACINALYDTESFQECRQTCLEAKVDFPAKIEFARKAALCLAEMHQGNRAIKELEGIVQSKPAPWYMHLDLARILFENGQVEKAWSYACNAANARGEAKTKVNLFQLMARILLARGQRDFAALHLCLAQRIRKEQNWSIPDSLTDLIEKLNASTEVKESRELIRRCKNIWNKSSSISSDSTKTTEKDDNRYEGYLIMKNPQTPFGFISCQAFKQNIYVKASDIPENLKHDGSKLSFKTETSFDAKKNRQSLKASDIKPA